MNGWLHEAFKFTVGEEGGYVNDPTDPGGETKYGVSKRSYPMLDIKNLTLEDAKLIFKKDYWDKAGCEKLAYPLNVIVADNAYHSGVGAALANLKQYPAWKDLIIERIEDMADIARSRPASLKYLVGWVYRAVRLYRECLKNEHPISRAEA